MVSAAKPQPFPGRVAFPARGVYTELMKTKKFEISPLGTFALGVLLLGPLGLGILATAAMAMLWAVNRYLYPTVVPLGWLECGNAFAPYLILIAIATLAVTLILADVPAAMFLIIPNFFVFAWMNMLVLGNFVHAGVLPGLIPAGYGAVLICSIVGVPLLRTAYSSSST